MTPTKEFLERLVQIHGKEQAALIIRERIRFIRLGRVEKELGPIERKTKANLWRYLAHKFLDIKLEVI